MKKHIKLFVVALTILVFATGCSVLPTDKSDDKIIETIKDKMKTEMDRIGFTVNFDDYEFTLRKSGAYVYGGTVSIKDKRYDQPKITVYDGYFDERFDENEIGINPIAFVAHGYQDYVMKTLVNDKSRGNNLDEVLKISGGRVEADDMHGTGGLSGNKGGTVTGDPGSLETILLPNNLYGYGDYYTCFNYLDDFEYNQLFAGKSTTNFDYYEFTENADFVVIVIVLVASNIKNIEELQRKTNTLYNNQYTIFKLEKE